jgi:hypothetical protein
MERETERKMAGQSVQEKAVVTVQERVLEMVQGKAMYWALAMATMSDCNRSCLGGHCIQLDSKAGS